MSLESDGGMIYWQEKSEELAEKPAPVPLCPPKIPLELTRAQTRASAVKARRLTTWAKARTHCYDYHRDLVNESVFPCRYRSTMALHAHIPHEGWTVGPLVAAVQRYSLNPSTLSLSSSTVQRRRKSLIHFVKHQISSDLKGNSFALDNTYMTWKGLLFTVPTQHG
jgi:hypothetical protein